MPAILCTMPEGTFRRMFTPELKAEMEALGKVCYCLNPHEMDEAEYAGLWASADGAVTGWGVRAPSITMIEAAPRLRVINHTAGSVRMFPRGIIERGVTITTARAGIARTVAEFCLMNAMILLRRHAFYLDSDPERRAFLAPGLPRPYNETLFGKTVGLVGFGCIGRILRGMLAPFGCRVLVYDPYLSEEEARESNVQKVDLPALLKEARIVSLHAPDIPATRGMIGAKELAMLQDGAIFLNSARGRLVDTAALTAELAAGRFFAAIDVTDPEPLPEDHPLRSLPNVLFTPHVAGPTEDDLPEMTRMALEDLARCLRGEKPLYPISLEAYDLMSF